MNVLVPLSTFQEIPESSQGIVSFFARATYLQKLMEQGLNPMLIPPIYSKAYLDAMYKQASGMLLMGGDDINPERYGQKQHPRTEPTQPLRDETEIELTRWAIRDKMPFLGICRGSQMLSVASGGTLHQHLPDVVGSERHSMPGLKFYDDLLNAPEHEIHLVVRSKIASILQVNSLSVSTAHHQAADTVGPDFMISGKSDDGIAEVIENKDHDIFQIGVQSHIEHNPKFKPLFAAFAEACRKFNPFHDKR